MVSLGVSSPPWQVDQSSWEFVKAVAAYMQGQRMTTWTKGTP